MGELETSDVLLLTAELGRLGPGVRVSHHLGEMDPAIKRIVACY